MNDDDGVVVDRSYVLDQVVSIGPKSQVLSVLVLGSVSIGKDDGDLRGSSLGLCSGGVEIFEVDVDVWAS